MDIPQSTYCSDPAACFTVEGMSETSAGIFGYYCNEFAAHKVAFYIKKQGFTNVAVRPYDPKAPVTPGIHPLVEAKTRGY